MAEINFNEWLNPEHVQSPAPNNNNMLAGPDQPIKRPLTATSLEAEEFDDYGLADLFSGCMAGDPFNTSEWHEEDMLEESHGWGPGSPASPIPGSLAASAATHIGANHGISPAFVPMENDRVQDVSACGASRDAVKVTLTTTTNGHHMTQSGDEGGAAFSENARPTSLRKKLRSAARKATDALANVSIPHTTKQRSERSNASVKGSISTCSFDLSCVGLLWFDDLRDWLSSLSWPDLRLYDQSRERVFITPTLPLKDRMRVYFTATCYNLSHLSIGIGSLKRVMLSPIPILPRHASNRFMKNDKPGLYIDPCDLYLCWPSKVVREPFMLQQYLPSNFVARLPSHSLASEDAIFVSSRNELFARSLRVRFLSAEDALLAKSKISSMLATEDNAIIEAQYAVHFGRLPEERVLLVRSSYSSYSKLFPSNIFGSTNAPATPCATSAASKPCEASPLMLFPGNTVIPNNAAQSPSAIGAVSNPSAARPPQSSGTSVASSWWSGIESGSSSYYSYDSSASKKRRYERIESGYECQDCHKFFHRQCDRDKHWRTVHGERPHHCYLCDRAFTYNKDLIRHLKTVHDAAL